MTNIPANIVRFLILILLQVLVFNNIQFNGNLNPYPYVLFILLLPLETPPWLILILSFLLGISVDVFSNTIGMHASACVFMGYSRSFVLNALVQRDGYEQNSSPTISCYGISWFLKYSFLLILFHHTFLFFIEVFSFSNFGDTIIRILSSLVMTIVIILLSQFFMFEKKTY